MNGSQPPQDFDRHALRFHPLADRPNKVFIERDHISPEAALPILPPAAADLVEEVAGRLRAAKASGASRMLAFGAHTIKNGLSPILIRLIEQQWLTHLATNGAGIIHDWEFAFSGASSEDVRANVAVGRFGAWEETGRFLNLALALGAYQGFGYGAAVGKFVHKEALDIPSQTTLSAEVTESLATHPAQAAAAADLIAVLRENSVPAGRMAVPHPFKRFGLQSAAYALGVPFTGHPMFGHDIIYEHPMSCGAAIGRAAERDFLTFAAGVSRLEGGVYLSIGSAVMSPMVFEKTLSMARNLAEQEGRQLDNFLIVVVDLAPASWDWRQGEPPASHPDYYLRFNKTFARMGGEVRYLAADNRAFLLALLARLNRP